jgi:hypothetical protein
MVTLLTIGGHSTSTLLFITHIQIPVIPGPRFSILVESYYK